jgi:hypothetical protein
MKRLLQISILLVLAFALIVGMLQIGLGSELPTAGSACRVGWNGRATSCLVLGPSLKGPVMSPQVGWNG